MGLTEKRNSLIRVLSGGQRRRLDVALGIVGNPELLFLDEPTTGFDPEARRAFWDLVRDLRNTGATILLTTHYLDEAEALADRVGVISRGRILEIAPPAELGGRDTSLAYVRWNVAGVSYEERTYSPTEVIQRIASEISGEIPQLTVSRPSLEDIYLEMEFLVKYDEVKIAIQNIVDMPDKFIDLFIRLLHQNKGLFPIRKRQHFEKLTDNEILKMQTAFQNTFNIPLNLKL